MPRYRGMPDYRHDAAPATGVLLNNLGTPAAPTTSAVRRYLAEFLADPRVVELPRPLWRLILHGVILRTRPRRSAHAYAQVWTDQGSPLLVHTLRQGAALGEHFAGRSDKVLVEVGMRYGQPSIAAAVERLAAANVTRLLVLPLYPQYSATTTASTFDELTRVLRSYRRIPALRFIDSYHDAEAYIEALAQSIRAQGSNYDAQHRLLLSFHGVPRRYLLAGDPYHCQCHKTARLLAERLGLADEAWAISFQSRLGREEWLRPYTDEILAAWARDGVRAVDVACPGFAADCLETIEEVGMQYRDLFLDAGGEAFSYIPALNESEAHVRFLAGLIEDSIEGWAAPALPEPERERALHSALKLGAQQ